MALAFLRDPARSLAGVRFLRELKADGQEVRAVLVVNVPMLGEIELPLHSRVVHTPPGARLEAQPVEHERAWIELSGAGQVERAGPEEHVLAYTFHFTAHIDMPSAEKWGGAAFEKMVRAAAERTLSRLAQELPEGMAKAVSEAGL